jgi:hypothetical protein
LKEIEKLVFSQKQLCTAMEYYLTNVILQGDAKVALVTTENDNTFIVSLKDDEEKGR